MSSLDHTQHEAGPGSFPPPNSSSYSFPPRGALQQQQQRMAAMPNGHHGYPLQQQPHPMHHLLGGGTGQIFAGSHQLGSFGAPGGVSTAAEAQQQRVGTTPFDASDFPSLVSQPLGGDAGDGRGGGSGRGTTNFQGAQAGIAGTMGLGPDSAYSLQFGMLRHKHGAGQNGEFSIQSEEFPALGGNGGGGEMPAGGQGQPLLGMQLAGMPPPPPPKDSAAMDGLAGAPPPPPPMTLASDKPTEKFGLLGLLGVIRMSDADLTTLALGTDLTTLGLNLNSPGSLYKSFASPWSDPIKGGAMGLQDASDANSVDAKNPKFKAPQCYLQQVPLLQPSSIKSFPLETLFYMFYSTATIGGEVRLMSDKPVQAQQQQQAADAGGNNFQSLAAEELWSRGWWYHRELKLWLARVPNTEPVVKTDRYERGSFLVFDSGAWDIVRKDNFVLQYSLAKGS